MTFLALLAAAVGTFCAGLLVGLWANRPWAGGLPNHPTLRPRERRPLRVIDGGRPAGPYDWQHDEGRHG